jgi:hypothetical protein
MAHKLSITRNREQAEAGCTVGYGKLSEPHGLAPVYVDKMLRGAAPQHTPAPPPANELIVDQKTANTRHRVSECAAC